MALDLAARQAARPQELGLLRLAAVPARFVLAGIVATSLCVRFLLAAYDYMVRANPHLDRKAKRHLKLDALRGVELGDGVARRCGGGSSRRRWRWPLCS